MALLENIGEAMVENAGGVFVLAGAVLAAPLVLPMLRPIAKELVKGGLYLTDRVRETTAGAGEQWNDLVAEARLEMKR